MIQFGNVARPGGSCGSEHVQATRRTLDQAVRDLASTDASPVALRDSLSWADVRTWAAIVVAGGWAGYLLFTGMPQLTLHVFPRTIALHAVVGGMALTYLAYLAVARKLPGGTPLDAGVIALAGAYAIGTWASIAWRPSVELTLQLFMAVVAFYVLSGLPVAERGVAPARIHARRRRRLRCTRSGSSATTTRTICRWRAASTD